MSLNGKDFGSGQMDRIMILKKEIDPWGYSDPALALGLYACIYDHYSRTNLLVYTITSQTSGEDLQDHWSSVFVFLQVFENQNPQKHLYFCLVLFILHP